jgi:hypothetical protein
MSKMYPISSLKEFNSTTGHSERPQFEDVSERALGYEKRKRSDFICICICVYIQGGAVNRGLKRFFSLYRPSCLIEAYDRPEKYWLVWAGPLASHLFNLNFIFLSDGLTAAAQRAACFVYIYRR